MAHIRKIIPAMFCALLIIAGCAVHRPQRIELSVAPPDSFLEETGSAAVLDSAGRWWESFGDTTLNALMDTAFVRNLGLARAFARLEQLEAVARTTSAARWPSLTAGADAGRAKQKTSMGGATGNTYTMSAAAGFELDLWRKLGSRTRAARLQALASGREINALYLSLSAQLADLYYLMVESRAQLELTDRTVDSYADILALVERRYKEGIAPAVEVYQARQNLTAAQAGRPVYEANLALAEHAVSILLGRYPGRDPAGGLARLPETLVAFPAGLPSGLITRRPDIQAGLLRLRASDALVAAAVAERFPSFNLLGNYGSSRSEFPGRTLTGSFWSWLAGLTLPLVDGGRRRAEVDRSRAVFKENLAGYRQTVLQAFQEVEDALVRNRTTEERIVRIEQRVGSTSAMLRLSIDNYLQGLTDYLPVLTAQSLDFTTRSQLLSARRQLISDRISLARALGGNWMAEESGKRLNEGRKKGQTDE